MDDKLIAALIGLAGIAIGLVVRDVVMALVLTRKKESRNLMIEQNHARILIASL